jgi:hypothetical protein
VVVRRRGIFTNIGEREHLGKPLAPGPRSLSGTTPPNWGALHAIARQKGRSGVLLDFSRDFVGGEGGIRTHGSPYRSLTCGFFVAAAAVIASNAVAHCPILPDEPGQSHRAPPSTSVSNVASAIHESRSPNVIASASSTRTISAGVSVAARAPRRALSTDRI